MKFCIEVTGTGQLTRNEVQRILDHTINLGLETAETVVESANPEQRDAVLAQQVLGVNIHSPHVFH